VILILLQRFRRATVSCGYGLGKQRGLRKKRNKRNKRNIRK
jgi:hypothetical protein